MALATLSIDIEARLANLEAGLDKANRISAKNALAIERHFDGINAAAKTIGTTLVTAFAGVSIVGLTRSLVDGLDALNDFADATGASVENASALEDVALRTGASLDTVEGILVKFNAGLKEADGKNGISQALKAIGLDAEQLKQIDPAEALRQTAVALSRFADDGNKARLVQELFGKSVREAAPFLKDLAEQGSLNAKVTGEQAEQAEKFAKSISALQKNVLDLARDIAGPLLTALNKFFDRLEQKRDAYGGVFAGYIDNFRFDQADDPGANLAKTFEKTEAVRKRLSRVQGLSEREGLSDVLLARYAKEKVELEAQLDLLKRREAYLLSAAADPGGSDEKELARRGRGTVVGSVGSFGTKDEKAAKERRGIEGSPVDRLEAFRHAELQAQATVDQALASANLADIEQRRTELLKDIEKHQQLVNDAVAATPTEKIEHAEQMLELLRAELEKTSDPAMLEKLREAIALTGEEIDRLKNPISKTEEKVDDFARRAAENIQDELGNVLFDIFKGDLDKIGDRFGDMLLRLAAEAQAAQLGKYLFGESLGGKGSGLVGQIGGLIGSYFTGGTGGGTPPIADGTGATGDFARFDRLYQAAEGIDRVPHDGFIAQLHKDEKVVPARYRDGGGAGVVNNISVSNESSDVQASARARPNGTGGADIEIMIKRVARQAVAEDIGAGGQVDRAMRSAYGVGRQTPRRS